VKHGKRIERLEKLFAASLDKEAPLVDPDTAAVLDEYGFMKQAMSDRSYRGSLSGLVKIEPRNVAREFYGRPYTQREFRELAISRALQKRGRSPAEIADLMDAYLAFFEEGFEGARDKYIGAID
jgi:hypothetical protein